jgi:glycosyltransferase involved in cell wall biosynthesis
MAWRNSKHLDLLCDTRWNGPHGIAKFSAQVLRRLPEAVPLPAGLGLFHPLDPLWLSVVVSWLAPRVYFSPGFNPPLLSTRPFVFVVHDLNYVHCRENSDPLRRLYFNSVVRPACRRAACVLTVSEFSKRQIVDWARIPERRVVNVSAGVDPQFRPDGARHAPGYPYVLYVGNRLAHKNLPRLFAGFAAARLDCKLLLLGQADAQMESLARHHEISDKVRYAGVVDDVDMPALYRGATAVVLPSLFEGFGLPAIEAMACGVPVLASNATSLPEVVGAAALLVDPRSIAAIDAGLRQITSDATLRSTLAGLGLHQAARYSWDATAAATRNVLHAVL